MKLRLLHEAENLQTLGREIAHISNSDKSDAYSDLSPDFTKFLQWLRRPDPVKWDDSVRNNVARFAKTLFQHGQSNNNAEVVGDARKWSELSVMDGTTVVAALTAAPDGVSRSSVIDDQDVPDGISSPIRAAIGDNAYSQIVSSLANNKGLRDRVLRAIQSNLGSMKSR